MQSYSIYVSDTEVGHYRSNRPKNAGRKAFKAICKEFKVDDIEFQIRNITTKKVYTYYGKRTKCDQLMCFYKFGEKRVFKKKYNYEIEKVKTKKYYE